MMSRNNDTNPFTEVGQRLTVVRRALGMSQVEIAKHLGLNSSTRWNNWEVGVNLIPPPMVRTLKRMLPGLTSDWVYDEDGRALTVEAAERLKAAKDAADEPVKRRGRPSGRH